MIARNRLPHPPQSDTTQDLAADNAFSAALDDAATSLGLPTHELAMTCLG
jgi:hypothetical protein